MPSLRTTSNVGRGEFIPFPFIKHSCNRHRDTLFFPSFIRLRRIMQSDEFFPLPSTLKRRKEGKKDESRLDHFYPATPAPRLVFPCPSPPPPAPLKTARSILGLLSIICEGRRRLKSNKTHFQKKSR